MLAIVLSFLTNRWTIGIVLGMVFLGGVYYAGYHHRDVQFQAYLQQEKEVVKAADTTIHAADAVHEKIVVQEKVVVKTVIQQVNHDIEKYIDRPIYHNICLDDDGLRDANRALQATAPTGVPDAAVPKPNPAF
jgi:hypothetical protein